jgi:hypothetical protein
MPERRFTVVDVDSVIARREQVIRNPESSSMKRNDPTHRTIDRNVRLISPSIITALRTQKKIASATNA